MAATAPRFSALAYGEEDAVQRVLAQVRAAHARRRRRRLQQQQQQSDAQVVAVEVVNEPGKVVIGASDRALFDAARDALAAAGIPTGAFALQAAPPASLATVAVRAAAAGTVVLCLVIFVLTDLGDRFLADHTALRHTYVGRLCLGQTRQ
jgi:hypothetical protein